MLRHHGEIMTKKAKYLFLIIATLFLVACGGNQVATPTIGTTPNASNGKCTFPVKIQEPANPNPAPGDTVYLLPEVAGNAFGFEVAWEADTAVLADRDQYSATLVVPNGVQQIKVNLKMTNQEGCEGEDLLIINVDVPIVAGAVAGTVATAEPTPTATQAMTATAEPTAIVTHPPQATPEPTATLTPTATATRKPVLVATAEPTAVSLDKPIITYLEFLPGGAVIVHWAWTGQLSPTQNFAVRFWSQNDPRPEARFSITWTKEFAYEFSVNNVDFPIGTYLVNVAVMEGPSDGVHTEVVRSDDRPLFVDAPSPTTVPPPLP